MQYIVYGVYLDSPAIFQYNEDAILDIAGWCNGSTAAFGAANLGSNPSPAERSEAQ